ncbi:MAG: indolepyruvate oxidoreductase subunit beta [Nitrospirae bacterium]|nr:MAG: indolepyruvate oxidoreductase subunit beta [Nitrospirota bacterium]
MGLDVRGDIVITGVGGQGIILASEILSAALLKAGFDVKQSEVHGMAQRGGSVVSHIRYGERVFSPVIDQGGADFILSFELLEAARYLNLLKKGGRVIINNYTIPPPTVATGVEEMNTDVPGYLNEKGVIYYLVDALEMASEIGNVRVVNSIMVGGLSVFLPMDKGLFIEVIKDRVKKEFVDINLKAFERGREVMEGMLK